MSDIALGMPAIPGFMTVDWRLMRNAAEYRSFMSQNAQGIERAGARWMTTVQCPPLQDDDAGITNAFLSQISRRDRYAYLSPPQNSVRGNWNPAELVSNGTFLGGATTGWAGSNATLSVNARRLKVVNTASSGGSGQQAITCEAGKPHVLICDAEAGSTSAFFLQMLSGGGTVVEMQAIRTGPSRAAELFYPSAASMTLVVANNVATVGAYNYFKNISVCRCLVVDGGGQSGTSLNVKGGPTSLNAALKAGEFFSLRCKNRWNLLRLIEDFDTDANGKGTLRFESVLRDVPVDGEAVIVRNPFGRFRMPKAEAAAAISAPNFHGFAFDLEEDINEISGEIQSDLIWAWDAENLTLAPQIGTGTPTFTNASAVATYFDSTGVMRTAAANTPRYDYDPVTLALKGLLVEEARTNTIRYSEQFENAVWSLSSVTVTANDRIAPDGTVSMDKLVFAASANANIQTDSTGTTPANGQQWSASCWVYAPSAVSGISIQLLSLPGSQWNSGDMGLTIPAGLSRVTVTSTAITGITSDTYLRMYFVTRDSVARTIWAWGAQLEVGAFASSYIKTTSAAVTRNKDDDTLLTSAIPGYVNGTLTFVAEIVVPAGSSTGVPRIIGLTNGSQTPMNMNSISSAFRAQTYDGAGNVSTANTAAYGSTARIASAFSTPSDEALALNGGTVATGTLANFSASSSITFGGEYAGPNQLNGWLRKLRIYKSRLPNQMVKALSA